MARTVLTPRPPPRQADASLGQPTPFVSVPESSTPIDYDNVLIRRLAGDEYEMIMTPVSYEDRNDVGDDAEWREDEDGDADRCWKTTIIYQHIDHHPRLVR